jgi:hypothetical protein
MSLTQYYTATTLDGFLADSDHFGTVAPAADGCDAPVATSVTPAGVRR